MEEFGAALEIQKVSSEKYSMKRRSRKRALNKRVQIRLNELINLVAQHRQVNYRQ